MPRVTLGGKQPNTIASLSMWFKADAIIGLADGASISTWNDSSINANNVTNSGGNRPVYKTNQINSLPIVRFTAASSQYLKATGVAGLTSQSFSYFVVFKMASLGANRDFITAGQNQGGRLFRINTANNLSLVKASIANMGNGNFVIPDTTTFRIGYLTYNSAIGNAAYRVNGVYDTNNAQVQTFTDSSPIISIGRDDFGAAEYMDGDIAEIIMFSEVLSEVNRINTEQYLAKKYNAFGITTTRITVS